MTVRTSTLRKSFSAWVFFLLIAVLWPIHTWAGFLYDQLLPRDPGISKSDDRRYALYIPSSYSGSTAAPLVIALHGCHQTERMVADKSRLEEIADRDGVIVAYL